MDDEFIKSRRNVLAISTFAIFYVISWIEPQKISFLGSELIIKSSIGFDVFLGVALLYFSLRYFHYDKTTNKMGDFNRLVKKRSIGALKIKAQKEILEQFRDILRESHGSELDYRIIQPIDHREVAGKVMFSFTIQNFDLPEQERRFFPLWRYKIQRNIEGLKLCLNEYHFLEFQFPKFASLFAVLVMSIRIGTRISDKLF